MEYAFQKRKFPFYDWEVVSMVAMNPVVVAVGIEAPQMGPWR